MGAIENNGKRVKMKSFGKYGIEKACRDDLAEILALQKAAFMDVARLIRKFELPALLQTEAEIDGEYEIGVILKYVAEDGRIVGSVRAFADGEDICRIGKLIVAADRRNRGVGRALMAAIESYFPSCRKFALFTSEETPNTFHLYTKIGYHTVGKKEMGGTVMLLMEKDNPPPEA